MTGLFAINHWSNITWYTGTKSNDTNGSDGIFEADKTANMGRNITDKGRYKANHGYADHECWVASN